MKGLVRYDARTLPLNAIRVGKRHRKDMGDIAGLAASMADLDMLEPIVVRPAGRGRYELVCGARRLAGAKQFGQTKVPVIVRNLTDAEALKAEYAENTHRKDFTLSEAVAIKRALEPLERAAAKERQRQSKGRGKKGGQVAPPLAGRSADKVAKATGVARRTLEKAEAVIAAAEAEPEKFGKLLEDMDRSGKVDGVYRRLALARQAEIIRAEPPPLPERGPYRVIVVDPPWPYGTRYDSQTRRVGSPYPEMTLEQICAFPVASIAHEDCVLWLWTTNRFMRHAFGVLDAWGFEDRTILTWVKDKMGTGDWLRGQTEHVLMACRGKPTIALTSQTTALHAPMRGHSQKPEEFYALVKSLCPAPPGGYCELFARSRRPGWDGHGDEINRAQFREAAE
jgi:N6-adenosine-specific RNA methylase IME4/ParB-like chromosome segregation protein Spo0J